MAKPFNSLDHKAGDVLVFSCAFIGYAVCEYNLSTCATYDDAFDNFANAYSLLENAVIIAKL